MHSSTDSSPSASPELKRREPELKRRGSPELKRQPSREETVLLPQHLHSSTSIAAESLHSSASIAESAWLNVWAGVGLLLILLGLLLGLLLFALVLVNFHSELRAEGGRPVVVHRSAGIVASARAALLGNSSAPGGKATLTLDGALDVDGDIKLWRRSVRLRLSSTAVGWWREVVERGCVGELHRWDSGNGFLQGRVHCPQASVSRSRYNGSRPSAQLRAPNGKRWTRVCSQPNCHRAVGRGRVAVWEAAGSKAAAAEFLIQTARPPSSLATDSDDESLAFGEVDASDAEAFDALDEVQDFPAHPDGTLESPLRVTISLGRGRR